MKAHVYREWPAAHPRCGKRIVRVFKKCVTKLPVPPEFIGSEFKTSRDIFEVQAKRGSGLLQ